MTRTPTVILATLTAVAAVNAQGKIDFQRQILPILEESCIECHGAPTENSFGLPVQPKGGLRLDGRAWILVGGRSGAVLVPGDRDSSKLYQRIDLPADDPDRMPNQGAPLTERQKELIGRWISEGLEFGSWRGAAGPGPEVVAKALSEARVASTSGITARLQLLEDLASGMTPPLEPALARAAGAGCQIVPVVPGSPLLRATFVSNVGSVTDEDLQRLEPLAAHITELGLGGTGVTDDGLSVLQRMTRLTRLDLHGTAVTDAGLRQVAELSELRYLNMHSTAVSDDGVRSLGQLRRLTAVYVWNTEVTEEGAALLQEMLPGTRISHAFDVFPARQGPRRGRR